MLGKMCRIKKSLTLRRKKTKAERKLGIKRGRKFEGVRAKKLNDLIIL